jgi:hypothetical protein
MTDKELLELSAKAAGFIETASVQNGYGFIALCVMDEDGDWTGKDWNPLTDDGDAFRLAVKLNMLIECSKGFCCASAYGSANSFRECVDIVGALSATRRAIVRAAAEIGKSML